MLERQQIQCGRKCSLPRTPEVSSGSSTTSTFVIVINGYRLNPKFFTSWPQMHRDTYKGNRPDCFVLWQSDGALSLLK